jgi:NhaA family Na+:H+ antiporter
MAGEARDLQRQERFAGLLLIAAAVAALVLANSGFSHAYHAILDFKFGPLMPRFGQLSVHYWIADGLMAIFFLLVGLEVKREWYVGRLATPADRRLPIVAAVAGMAVPALIYLAVLGFDPDLARGWAIPAATDIAFAVGVLALLGSRANPSIKVLLVTIAIIDDIGAVIIIALAYTSDLDARAIGASVILLGCMAALNLFGVRRIWPYLIGFTLLWYAMLASGIHATVAGVLAALTIPLAEGEANSPLKRLEHAIHPWVMFGVMPLFGLASAGVELGNFGLSNRLPVAIMLGLFVGKQVGVFGAIWATVRSGLARRPNHVRWSDLYGASVLCGIGFTMSLFIGALAFPDAPSDVEAAKIGTLAGSLLSAILGYGILRYSAPSQNDAAETAEATKIFGGDQPEGEHE